jgi:hypothetical protein
MPDRRTHLQKENENDEAIFRAEDTKGPSQDPIDEQQRRYLIRNARRTRLLLAELADKINDSSAEVRRHLSAIKWALWLAVVLLGVIVWRQLPF